MTAVSFPDLKSKSPDGRFLFTARSPHNADGSRSAFQSHFQYCLSRDGQEVWSGQQEEKEPSPRRLYTSNSGHTVVKTHGYGQELLICRDPKGRKTGQPALGHGEEGCTPDAFRDPRFIGSTAGLLYRHDLGYFFYESGWFFGLHFSWFRRLLIDLDRGLLVTDSLVNAAAIKEEKVQGLKLVAAGMDSSEEQRDTRFEAGVECLLHHRMPECFDYLCRLESDPASIWDYHHCHTLEFRYCGPLKRRARLALALRLSNRNPSGLPGTAFFDEMDKPIGDWPSEVPDRDDRWGSLPNALTAHNVIHHLGAPDKIVPFSHQNEKQYDWGDRWSYFRGLGKHTEEVIFSWKPGSRGEELESLLVQPVDRVYSPRF
ncbi:MAG: hypothetical protein KC800_04760 [Candidatus Eremiobacteraeota bacterium]|nr:hypothetical protein [Candidatus Eremiobacteraeota bacterium]